MCVCWGGGFVLCLLFFNNMVCIHTSHSFGLLYFQEAFSVLLLPYCFSTEVFQRFWYESLMLHTFSLQFTKSMIGSADMSLMSASPCIIYNYGVAGCVSSGQLCILCRDTSLQTAEIEERKRSVAFTPSPFSFPSNWLPPPS